MPYSWVKRQVEISPRKHTTHNSEAQMNNHTQTDSIALLTFTKYPFQIGRIEPPAPTRLHAHACRGGRIWGTEPSSRQNLVMTTLLFMLYTVRVLMLEQKLISNKFIEKVPVFFKIFLVDNLSWSWKAAAPGNRVWKYCSLNVILTLLLKL
jgi:hypothetical protein